MREDETAGDVRQDIGKLVDVGNWVASYLGNGLIGGCFDYSGLQFQDGKQGRPDIVGDTYFVSQYHYVHGMYGMDYALPIGRLQGTICVDGEMVEPSDPKGFVELEQVLRIDEGVLHTDYTLANGARVEQVQFFSQARKNLFVLRARCDHPIDFDFLPVDRTAYHYESWFETDVVAREIGGCRIWEIPTNLQTTVVGMRHVGDTLFVAVYSSKETSDPGAACVKEIESAADAGFEKLLQEQSDWWRRYWDESDVQLPHPLGPIWRRANYYIGCSLADRKTHPPLVFGLARVQWPAYFPQDYLFAYENCFAANHMRQAAGTSEHWFDILPHAQEYARRLFGLDGAVYPWTPPVFDWHDYHHDNQTPNECYFEMHNSAYVAKMCYDYYVYTLDEEYLRERGYPVIREIARMYASMTSVRDGRAQITYTPNKSQDEESPGDRPNYFDTLVSAEYTLALAKKVAEKLGDEGTAQMCGEILEKGYAFERLEVGDTYAVFEGDTHTSDFQKHPVQLNPLTWLPIMRFFWDERVLNYHKRRYEMCYGYGDASSTAWTLGQFMLASCRLRMPEELARDIENVQRCKIMDPDYIQAFESSRRSPHYLTTIGLFMQAITETLVQSHNGFAEFFPCLLSEWRDRDIGFRGIRLPGGFLASGSWRSGSVELTIQSPVGGPFEFSICGEPRMMKVSDGSGREVYAGPASQKVRIETERGASYVIRA